MRSHHLLRIIALLISMALLLPGCALIWQGHDLDLEKVNKIQVGVTTEQDLIHMLGMPEGIVHKHSDGIKVFQYKDVNVLTVGIPFFFSLGRGRQRGLVMNVGMKDNRVVEIEKNFMTEQMFSRSVDKDHPGFKSVRNPQ
ncbi:MAG: hypothetical protein AB7P49_03915 [Bdellovibrionales bacterium]